MRVAPKRRAYTLLELMIVISIMGILAAAVLPATEPTVYGELHSAANTLAGDIALTRSLAVSNNSSYRIDFSTTLSQYTISHSGTNPLLDPLPGSPFHETASSGTQYVVRLIDLPQLSLPVGLHAVLADSTSSQTVTDVEFGPLGETTRTPATVIWLTAGRGREARFISLRVDPVTGLSEVEDFQQQPPLLPASDDADENDPFSE